MFTKTLNLLIIVLFIVFLIACGNENPNEEEHCNISHIVRNNELQFGYLDTNNVFYPMPVFIYDSTTSVSSLVNMTFSEHGYPMTLKTTMKKLNFAPENSENSDAIKEIKENVFRNTFWGTWDNPPAPYIVFNMWFVDENCNVLRKIRVPFYIKEETDSNYVLTTQIFSEGKYIGSSMFFVERESFEKLDRINYSVMYKPGIDPITLIPASQTVYVILERSHHWSNICEYEYDWRECMGMYPCFSARIYDAPNGGGVVDCHEWVSDTIKTMINLRNSTKVYR